MTLIPLFLRCLSCRYAGQQFFAFFRLSLFLFFSLLISMPLLRLTRASQYNTHCRFDYCFAMLRRHFATAAADTPS